MTSSKMAMEQQIGKLKDVIYKGEPVISYSDTLCLKNQKPREHCAHDSFLSGLLELYFSEWFPEELIPESVSVHNLLL